MMAPTPICQRCAKPVGGPRAVGPGLNSGGVLVCSFCATIEEHKRYLAEVLRRLEGDAGLR